MANLANFVDECLSIALANNLNAEVPVLITTESVSGAKTVIVCSFIEPSDLVLPYNVSWIDSDPDSVDYKDTFKRTSKEPIGDMSHTWEQVLTLEDIYNPEQYYDEGDLPRVEAKESEISQALEHVDSNVLSNDPHKSRFYVDIKLENVDSNVKEIADKSNYNYILILELQRQLQSLTSVVQELQEKVDSGINSLVFVQEISSNVWAIEHNFKTVDIVCQMYTSEGIPILPTSMGAIDENTWSINFETPISGKAILVGL